MEITKRHLILGGGHVAAAVLLLLSACGPGGGHDDSGQVLPDAGPMADADVDMPDANVPPGDGGDMMPDLGGDGGVAECTPEMMLNRVTTVCEPELPVGVTYVEDSFIIACLDTMNGDLWADSSGSGSSAIVRITSPYQPVGGVAISLGSAGDASPCTGNFTYGGGGIFYCNEKNAAVEGAQGNHTRLIVNTDCTYGTVQMFSGGNTSETPDSVKNVWRQ